MCIGFIWLRTGTNCGYTKGEKYIEQLNNCQCLNNSREITYLAPVDQARTKNSFSQSPTDGTTRRSQSQFVPHPVIKQFSVANIKGFSTPLDPQPLHRNRFKHNPLQYYRPVSYVFAESFAHQISCHCVSATAHASWPHNVAPKCYTEFQIINMASIHGVTFWVTTPCSLEGYQLPSS